MKKTLKLFITSLLITVLYLKPDLVKIALAQKVTPTITPTINEASESSTTSNLKDRIEKIVEEKKDSIEATLAEISTQKKGYVGEVVRVTKETLTIENKTGTVIIPFDDQLKLIKKQKAITPDDIAVGDFVTVIGSLKDDTLMPERLIVVDKLMPKRQIVNLGTIKEVSAKTITVVARADQSEQNFNLDTKTKYFDLEGEKIAQKLLTKDIQCLVVGYEDSDKKLIATTVKILTTAEVLDNTKE